MSRVYDEAFMSVRPSGADVAYDSPPSWREDAACRFVDSSVFWPDNDDFRLAAEICGRCDVIDECFKDAIANADVGKYAVFRAGMTGPKRAKMRARISVVRECASCGGRFLADGNASLCSDLCRLRERRAATRRWRSA